MLAEGDKPVLTFHISSGAMATPSDPGGYHDVPTHPASHGCIRTEISQARQIYNWLTIGTPVFVY